MIRFKIVANMENGKCVVESNSSRNRWAELLAEIVRSQIGSNRIGGRVPEGVSIFTIDATIYLANDRIAIKSNCVSLDLEVGIIASVAARIGATGNICYI